MSDVKYKVTWVDPPQGHLYGFPKAVDTEFHEANDTEGEERLLKLKAWFIKNGYPEKEHKMLDHTRYGIEEVHEYESESGRGTTGVESSG